MEDATKETKKLKEMYFAYIRNSCDKPSIEFNYGPIKVVKQWSGGMIEVDRPYFVRGSYSTNYFEPHMLDSECKISKELTCYYSIDQSKCVEWLEEKRDEMIADCELMYRRLKKSVVKEIDLDKETRKK